MVHSRGVFASQVHATCVKCSFIHIHGRSCYIYAQFRTHASDVDILPCEMQPPPPSRPVPPPKQRLESSSRKPWVGRLTLATVACLYGTNYSAVKFVGGLLETSNFLALRFGLASLVLLPFLRGVSAEVWKAGAEVGVYATLGYWGQAWAMRVRNSTLLVMGLVGGEGGGLKDYR